MNIWIIIIPIFCALLGWSTNWLAIKMLFHPRTPQKFLGFTFQGIFPRGQKRFAEKLGQLISKEFLSFGDIEEKFSSPENFKKVLPLIETRIDDFLKTKLSEQLPFLSMFIGDKRVEGLKKTLLDEIELMFPDLMKQFSSNLKAELDIEQIVIQKVSNFSSDKLEEILLQIMKKELKFVEILGGVIGFILGIIQVIIQYVVFN